MTGQEGRGSDEVLGRSAGAVGGHLATRRTLYQVTTAKHRAMARLLDATDPHYVFGGLSRAQKQRRPGDHHHA